MSFHTWIPDKERLVRLADPNEVRRVQLADPNEVRKISRKLLTVADLLEFYDVKAISDQLFNLFDNTVELRYILYHGRKITAPASPLETILAVNDPRPVLNIRIDEFFRLRNPESTLEVNIYGTYEMKDSNGFVIDALNWYNFYLQPGENVRAYGYKASFALYQPPGGTIDFSVFAKYPDGTSAPAIDITYTRVIVSAFINV